MGKAGNGKAGGISIFFIIRNTAVRGAEVHILPLNCPLKKVVYGLQAHGRFVTNISTWVFRLGAELFN
ncbi:hypothetical protein AP75_13925 [Kaistella haifensis DSM 19056]|uniref:Uncharacterized protein n=1 Tax=Kaistella haifensis DSM 19056 TaxID=1450526 RepID=A0A246B6C8_9FLAO|nr:hypothetical protein AP75_13925 [Kaistella haifensis DSM 19056]